MLGINSYSFVYISLSIVGLLVDVCKEIVSFFFGVGFSWGCLSISYRRCVKFYCCPDILKPKMPEVPDNIWA